MNIRRHLADAFLACGVLCLLSTPSFAQTGGQPVRVQLPTWHVFGVSTTVLVPDRGTLVLGGVNRGTRGSQNFGPGFRNRSYNRSGTAGTVSVSATIIDHAEIDRALFAEAARRRGATHDVLGRPVSRTNRATAEPQEEKAINAKPRWQALWKAQR